MDERHLENLLTDQALGELSPSAAWLLEQYLTEHPEQRRLADQVNQTVDLARRALLEPDRMEASLPPMPEFATVQRRRWISFVLWPAACAACLAAGWMLNVATGTIHSDKTQIVAVNVPIAPVTKSGSSEPVRLAAAAKDAEAGFWSVRSIAERAIRQRRPADTTAGIVWKAPFQPKIDRGVQ